MKLHRFALCVLALCLTLPACAPSPSPAEPAAATLPPAAATLPPAAAAPLPTAAPLPDATAKPFLPGQSIPIIYDDDGSGDGSAALFYLLAHPLADVRAVNVSYGEAHPEIYIQHLGRLMDSFGIRGIPLGAGQDAPLAGENAFPDFLRSSSDDYWGLPVPFADRTYPVRPAAELILETARASDRPVTVFVSGASTNLAQALRQDPAVAEKIAAVYMMGGAVRVPGNLDDLLRGSSNKAAEWNIFVDPLAAKEVFEAGIPLYLVPLDATNQVAATRDDTAEWRKGGPPANAAADLYDNMLNNWGGGQAAVWDLMTAAVMLRPDLCAFEELRLEVITAEGDSQGQTAERPGQAPNAHVCLRPDVPAVKQAINEVFAR